MRKVFIYLLGAGTASSWWIAAEFHSHINSEGNSMEGLWVMPILLSVASLALGFMFMDDFEK